MRDLINLIEAAQQGEFLPELLFHGTDTEFTRFDRSRARTAQHIYTSPDINTARGYGDIVYRCHVRGPQADLTGDGLNSWPLLARLADEFTDRFVDHVEADEELGELKAHIVSRSKDPDYMEWEAEEEPEFKTALHEKARAYALEFFTNGKIYEYDMRGQFQDEVLSTVFDWGFNSVRMIDCSLNGEWLSVIANTPDDIHIIGRVV